MGAEVPMEQMDMSEAYLTIEDVAGLLQVSPKTVRRMVWRGEIPAFKVGHQWRFIADQVRKWAETRVSLGQNGA